MAGERYTKVFKTAAVKQITQEGDVGFQTSLDDLVLPPKASMTGGEGMAIMGQLGQATQAQ